MKHNSYHSKYLGATVYHEAEFIAFWGGIFSQWHTSDFVFEGKRFNCAEQAMMAKKAHTFRDQEAFDKIMSTSDPREQKDIGRTVKHFDAKAWDDVALDIVTQISYEKFNQDYNLRELIILSYPYDLVEASPYDKIWGIGMSEFDKTITDRTKWNGQNLLGKALMSAREMILNKY